MSCMHHTAAETMDLGMAMLIAESEDGGYEPISPVGSIGEGREIARDDYRRRMADLERGGSPLCPTVYKIWSRDDRGLYRVAQARNRLIASWIVMAREA